MESESTAPGLARRLGLSDAVLIGLGSMLGAGVFAAFTPAAAVSGSGLLIGLTLAAAVAYCNATASAQLAAQYPRSGGTYLYGREQLGEWWGFLAGWGFVVGKTASCAAMALTVAAYVVPHGWQKPVAVAAVAALVAVNCHGITRTAALTRLIVGFVLVVLALVVVTALVSGDADFGRLGESGGPRHDWYGVLQSAGLLFFAFAGYARIATLGEEVRRPSTTIPRAILLALALTVAIYVAVAVAVLCVLGPGDLADTPTPLADTAEIGWGSGAGTIVRTGGAAAGLGAMLALIAGIGRTALAMARGHDLPGWLAAVHPRHLVPHRAELTLGGVVCALVVTVDLRGAIGFSSFGVLVYYLVANLSAYRQQGLHRLYPRFLQLLGTAGCAALILTLPVTSIAVGLGVFAIGIAYRTYRLRERDRP